MPRFSLLAAVGLLVPGLLVLSGCQVLGVAAAVQPPPIVPPAYADLTGRSVAVWVWVDPGVDLDFPALSLQVATRVQETLEHARDNGTRRQRQELRDTTFPHAPASIVRYQKRDPMLNAVPITQIAPRLDVDRLIYIEITRFTTQGGAAAGLYRGVAEINISAVEVDPDRREGRIAYQEQNLQLVFPKRGPAEGTTTLPPRAAYEGLVREIGSRAAVRFISNPAEES